MAELSCVTMTGADDHTNVDDLVRLSQKYPFVEWGILQSESNSGHGRYPSPGKIEEIRLAGIDTGMKLSLHVQGRQVRSMLTGVVTIPVEKVRGFNRMQLNFHAEKVKGSAAALAGVLEQYPHMEFIFQIDEVRGNKLFDTTRLLVSDSTRLVPLFDVSGGAGLLPPVWPALRYGDHNGEEECWIKHGYAGGLGPHNIEVELDKILSVASAAEEIWIDMETHVRTPFKQGGGDYFDLDKVQRVLEHAAKFV